MENFKQIVFDHLSKGGSLQSLIHQYNNEGDKKEITIIGNILKNTFVTTEEHFNECYEKVLSLDLSKAVDLIDTQFPYAKNALLCKIKGDTNGFRNAIWDSIKPYGVPVKCILINNK